MATFKYIGEAPNGPFEMYGATWDHGTTAHVADPVFAGKLRNNKFFEEVTASGGWVKPDVEKAVRVVTATSETPPQEIRKRGRPKKQDVKPDGDTDPASAD